MQSSVNNHSQHSCRLNCNPVKVSWVGDVCLFCPELSQIESSFRTSSPIKYVTYNTRTIPTTLIPQRISNTTNSFLSLLDTIKNYK